MARALAELGRAAGYESVVADAAPPTAGDAAVVVASHGEGEEHALTAALSAGVPYVALVASRTRGESVRASLDVPEDLRERVRVPAGLDIGARTPAEIAVSILAQLIAERAPRYLPRSSTRHTAAHGRLRPSQGSVPRLARRLDAASAARSSCSRTAAARCSTTCSAPARACRVRPARLRPRRWRRRTCGRRSTCAAPTWSSTGEFGDGLLLVDRRGAGHGGPADRRPRPHAGRPARRAAGDHRGATGRPRGRAARRLPLRERARASAGVRAQHVRRPRDAARRQGRLAAHGPVRRRGGRRPAARSRATSTRGRTTKQCWRISRDGRDPRRGPGRRDAGAPVSTAWTTSPTTGSPPRCSSRCASRSRCCWRARPGSARPRPPSRSPRSSAPR